MSAEITRLLNDGQFEKARAALQRMLRAEPRNPHVLDALAVVHVYLGEPQRSLYFSETALAILPDSGPMRVTYANTLTRIGKREKARQEYQHACRAADAPHNAWSGLSALLLEDGEFEGAVAAAREGLTRFGPTGPLLEAYYSALTLSGQPYVTVKEAEHALDRIDAPQAMLLAAVATNYCDDVDGETVKRWHQGTGAAVARAFPARQTRWMMSRDKGRPLRVGILSSDLRQHPVASFIAALLEKHDRTALGVCVFSTVSRPDAVTAELKRHVREWVECAGKAEEQIREAIVAKQIDVLIELNGLTNGHRLGVCAMRAAPVQVTYCGYPNTTGLAEMDYRIVDAITDPEMDTQWHSERLLRMPGCFLCYSPRLVAMEGPPGWVRPSDESPIVFGSFNALAKISDSTLRLWAAALEQVGSSRLLVKTLGFKDAATRERILRRAVAAGIAADRIELRGPTENAQHHLRLYREIDIALDTTPYNGTTTTCEALGMGVPVVTLRGPTHAGRVGASLLAAAGHPEWVAADADEYVAIAAALAADPALRPERNTRADALTTSPLCDAADWNARFESVLRRVWHAWCDANP